MATDEQFDNKNIDYDENTSNVLIISPKEYLSNISTRPITLNFSKTELKKRKIHAASMRCIIDQEKYDQENKDYVNNINIKYQDIYKFNKLKK